MSVAKRTVMSGVSASARSASPALSRKSSVAPSALITAMP
jgi:hypothetical protein